MSVIIVIIILAVAPQKLRDAFVVSSSIALEVGLQHSWSAAYLLCLCLCQSCLK